MSYSKRVVSFILAASLVAMPVGLAGCGSAASDGSGTPASVAQTPEEALNSAVLSWDGYTMSVEFVTDDPDDMAAGTELTGKGIRVSFAWISDEAGNGGFDGNKLFEQMEEHPIVLKDADGKEYTYTGGISDIVVEVTSDGMSVSKSMPRFGITFDVPLGSKIEDYVLSTGEGDDLQLVKYTSEAYAADIKDND